MHEKRQSLDLIASRTDQRETLSGPKPNQATVDDERYPGSFFRVPGVPMPGKTTWSLSK